MARDFKSTNEDTFDTGPGPSNVELPKVMEKVGEMMSEKNSTVKEAANLIALLSDDVVSTNEQQPILDIYQLIQPKIEPINEVANTSSGNRRKALPYHRKIFQRENKSAFKVEKLINDWEDDANERQKNQISPTDTPTSSNDIDDAISLTSGTSDSEVAFVDDAEMR